MATYNTIPNDEALLAQKQRSFKGLVAGAALASFVLGMVAASAISKGEPMGAVMQATTKRKTVPVQMNTKGGKKSSGDEYWWQDGSTSFRTVSPVQDPRRPARPPFPDPFPTHCQWRKNKQK